MRGSDWGFIIGPLIFQISEDPKSCGHLRGCVSRYFPLLMLPRIRRILFILFFCCALVQGPLSHASNALPKPLVAKTQLVRRYGNLPLYFEINRGQAAASVRFLSHVGAYSVVFRDHEADLLLPGNALQSSGVPVRKGQSRSTSMRAIDILRMLLVGGDSGSAPTGEARLPGTVNYFLGNNSTKWHRNIETFEKIRYLNALPGVNLLYYGDQRHLEMDFELAAGVDARTVQLQFKGARRLKLDQDGNLIVVAADGSVTFHKPVIYQTIAGTNRTAVNGGFQLLSKDTISFQVGNYDHAKPLIIDPVLSYSTYVGFPSASAPTAIAVDSMGEAYLTGTAPVLPITMPGAFQGTSMTKAGYWDYSAFVAKFNSTGSALIYCTYLGGSGNDTASAIALDAAGDAYVAGRTTSEDFPTSQGAFQSVNNAPTDTVIPSTSGFVIEINSSGTALVYSTYLGGHTNDQISGVAVDTSGSAYVTGVTRDADFPVTPGAFQSINNATATENQTGFISKINAGGTALAYSTYLGGSNEDFPSGIAVDSSGAAYITGTTESTDFPTTTGAFQTTNHVQDGAAFVTKLNSTGTTLAYSTYLSGNLSDIANAIAVDASGDAYITTQFHGNFVALLDIFGRQRHLRSRWPSL